MKPAGADQEKRPLLQHAWKGFQKYWKIADLDLNLPTEDLLDALQLDSTILTDSSSGWLLPISKTEIESTVKGEIEKCSRNTDCVGKLPNFIFWAILFDITSVAPLMKNYLEHSRNAEHDDIDDSLARSAVFVLLNAFEYHDMDTLRLASTFVENDENDEVREKAALLLANSQNFEDMEKARKELEEYQSAYASRCMPMLYRWYATGDEIFPLLDTFFEVFYEKDY